MKNLKTFVSSIEFSIGDKHLIEKLSILHENSEKLNEFKKMGFQYFRYSALEPSALAIQSMKKTLAISPVKPEEIDFLLYCSNTLWEEDYYTVIHRACAELNLKKAYPIGIHFTFCGNFSSGVRLASNMLKTGDAKNILLVCTDMNKSLDDPKRILEPAVAITSDGAASCIINTENPEYEVTGYHQLVKHQMSHLTIDDIYENTSNTNPNFFRYSLESFKGRKQTSDEFMEKYNYKPSDFSVMITNNYGLNTLSGFASESGIPFEKLYQDNVSENGHVNAADNLINLKCSNNKDSLNSGDKIIMLSTGPYSWGFLSLNKC